MDTKQPFRIEVDHQGGCCVVRLIGPLGMESCDDLQARLVELAEEPGLTLILDLSGLEFISSMGLSAIVAAHLRTRHTGGSVRLAAAPAHPRASGDHPAAVAAAHLRHRGRHSGRLTRPPPPTAGPPKRSLQSAPCPFVLSVYCSQPGSAVVAAPLRQRWRMPKSA